LRLKEIELEFAVKEAANLAKQAKALSLGRDALLVLNNIEPGTDHDGQLTGKFEIRAAAYGVVIERFVMPGEWIEGGQKILEVADYRTVQVEGELPESLIARMRARKTNKVRVRIPSNPSYLGEGTLRYMAPNLDPIKRTAHLIVDVPNPDGALLGEMWVNLSVVLREVKSAVAVPRSAVVVRGPMHFVFIQDDDQYQKQDIVPGYADDRFVEVKGGVAPGDIVVVQGAHSLTQLRPKGSVKKASSEASSEDAY
jgi:RND family efflux transporter MFP subunit